MARRRTKRRTHAGANNPAASAAVNGHINSKTDPKTMVIRIGAGEVGTNISQLATDVRQVMEPGTASRLKERKANRLRDYVTMCGPLGVSHLLLFSRSTSGNTNLRLALTPRGPTFHFRVEKYSLAKDVKKAQRHPLGGGKEYLTPPLVCFTLTLSGSAKGPLTRQLVMNNFISPDSGPNSKVPRHLETLTTTAFQSLFPPINPQKTPLKSIRRVLLLNREADEDDDGTFVVNFRHYAITTKTVGLSKPLRRLDAAEKLLKSSHRKGGVPNLGKLQDISEFMIGGENGDGYMTDGTSGSEVDTDAEVEIAESSHKRVLSAKARAAAAAADDGEEAAGRESHVERRAVKMVELGPRMRLRMTKVEEGLCAGKILWHQYHSKTKEEVRALEAKWEKRRKEKEARKKQQKENVEKKRAAKEGGKKSGAGQDEDAMDVDYDSDLYGDDGFDSEGVEGDAEELVNAEMEAKGEWEEEEEEIANGKREKKKRGLRA